MKAISGRVKGEARDDEELIQISHNDIMDAIASQVSAKPAKEQLSPIKPQKLEVVSDSSSAFSYSGFVSKNKPPVESPAKIDTPKIDPKTCLAGLIFVVTG
jgi:hypothetical protein